MQSTVCPVRSARCLSKSNMALAFAHDLIGKPLPTVPDHALTISVFAVEIAGDILVLAADRVRHLDIFDIGRPPERLEHGADHVAEAFGFAGADIENAADRGGVE